MPQSPPITVELQDEQASLDRHLATGDYDSPSDVLRAGLRALDREQAAFDQTVRVRVKKALDGKSKAIPAEEVLRKLQQRHFERWGEMPDDV